MIIKRTKKAIVMAGHAEDSIRCGMMTALSVSLLENLTERMHEEADHHISPGAFYLDTSKLTDRGRDLVDGYWYSMKHLARDYPHSFNVSEAM